MTKGKFLSSEMVKHLDRDSCSNMTQILETAVKESTGVNCNLKNWDTKSNNTLFYDFKGYIAVSKDNHKIIAFVFFSWLINYDGVRIEIYKSFNNLCKKKLSKWKSQLDSDFKYWKLQVNSISKQLIQLQIEESFENISKYEKDKETAMNELSTLKRLIHSVNLTIEYKSLP